MIEEVIDNIIQAEKTAESMVKESQVKAKEMIAKAKDVSIAMIEDEKKRVRSEADAMANKAIVQSEEIARKAIDECANNATQLGEKAMGNIDKATDYIIGRMTSKYDK